MMTTKKKTTPKKTAKTKGKGLGVLVLAAGKGERMGSDLPKVLHPFLGRPMIAHVLHLADSLRPQGIGIVVSPQLPVVRETIEANLKDWGVSRRVSFIAQKEQRGTGHAVQEAAAFVKQFDSVVLLCGDTPRLSYDTVAAMAKQHRANGDSATVLTARVGNPFGYGRIVRGPGGDLLRIVEESVADADERRINEINTGVYCFDTAPFMSSLERLKPKGPKRELFVTDAIEGLRQDNLKVGAFLTDSPDEFLGVNTRFQLANLERAARRRILERLMLAGVAVVDPASVYVDEGVEVGRDSVLEPGVILRGRTRIGERCRIGPFAEFTDTVVGDDCVVRLGSSLDRAKVGDGCVVGPMAHLRPGSVLGERAKVGNFSETKNMKLGRGSKVPHLSYVGDAEIGEDVNVGAGTITCNFDGREKHKTIIGDGAFIGSNTNLVAPVRVGKGARIGAGSTITDDVEEGGLAIARARQVVKPGRGKDA